MLRYKVFRQAANEEFVEIAQTTYLEDAEAVYGRWHSAMITDTSGEVLQTKNLESQEQEMLFGKEAHA